MTRRANRTALGLALLAVALVWTAPAAALPTGPIGPAGNWQQMCAGDGATGGEELAQCCAELADRCHAACKGELKCDSACESARRACVNPALRNRSGQTNRGSGQTQSKTHR
jgi:hypothetical protein